MNWHLSDRADPVTRRIADRHYNRQSPGVANFVPPGRCVVLRTAEGDAFWITSWPFAEYVKHEWAGAWICTAFRNEAPERYLSSDLILEAISATLGCWPDPPDLGLVTFVDPDKIRRKRDPGRCFLRAGFRYVGETKMRKLPVLQLLPSEFPPAISAIGTQARLFDQAVGA